MKKNICLKPCPFCGKTTIKIIPFEKDKFIISHWYEKISDCPIAAHDEGVGIGNTYFYNEEEAADTWNRRFTNS